MEQKKKIKIIIIVLAVLLGISLAALGGTFLYHKLANSTPATVTVPDNLITPDEDTTESSATQSTAGNTAGTSSAATEPASTAATKKAATIELYNKQPEDNTAFSVGNLFPGDSEAKYFCVQVSYHDKITVHYKAAVRPGYEELTEALKIRVKLLTTGETLYDGVIGEMPDSVTHKLASKNTTTDELYYEITAYLDTSVGNEHQNKDLIADFNWWVEETGNLDDSPKTGDTSNITLWAVLTAVSGCVLILLLFMRRRKEDEENG